ncbi:hypothetical protein M2459_001981 [Parabacteroides sp. PF5-5]|nr:MULTISPECIES: hypothetical protein [unclassified Parabacteroides]MDH6306747.1 hypothetical protein [Parabacteroides sp. PH5-39]MDH6317897.1 hypothetical protein [Parabacteroides sp. PF5-13]MDH6321400.1 hypothetical protein [Parabacteroides sp. PH5-13]MDH6325132.1 hypothetical protein [Parabacteroides sp. PH5-8]MDH6327430.1 hypothetical protein [Parabacteroides sp. PH5-41]
MNEILKTRFFSLLSESSQVTNEEMQSAYGNFIQHVKAVSSENDYAAIYRNLSNTRIELSALELLNRYEQGGKCPEICLSTKGFSHCQC